MSSTDVAKDESELKQLQITVEMDEKTRQRDASRKKAANDLRRERDEAFVKCANAVGIEPCTVLSDWVEADRLRPFFGAKK